MSRLVVKVYRRESAAHKRKLALEALWPHRTFRVEQRIDADFSNIYIVETDERGRWVGCA